MAAPGPLATALKQGTRFFRWLEDLPVPLPGVIAYYMVVALIRSYFETTLLHPGIFLVVWYFWNAYFIFCFLSGALIVSFLAHRPALKTLRASMALIWIVILPPLFDYYVIGRRLPYDYLFNQQIFKAVAEFFTAGTVGVGMRIEVAIYVIAVSVYVGLMARSWPRALAASVIFFFLGIVLVAQYPGVWVPLASYAAPMLPARTYQASFLLLFYLAPSLGLIAFAVYRQNRNLAADLKRGLDVLPLGLVVLFCAAGAVFARQTVILALIGPVYVALSVITVGLCLAAGRWAGLGIGDKRTGPLWDWVAGAALVALAVSYLISGFYGTAIIVTWLVIAAATRLWALRWSNGVYGQAALSTAWAVLAFLFGAVATRYQLLPEHFLEIGRAAAVALIVAAGMYFGPALRSFDTDRRKVEAAGALVLLTFLSPLLMSRITPILIAVIGGACLAAVITWSGRRVAFIQPIGLLLALAAFVYGSGLLTTPVIL